jgi:type I restriction enzyme S subunit
LFDLKTISNGANVPQINHYSFDDIYIYYPKSLKEQCAIVERLDALAAETSRLEGVYQSKLEAVEELRKSVLGKVFAGGL